MWHLHVVSVQSALQASGKIKKLKTRPKRSDKNKPHSEVVVVEQEGSGTEEKREVTADSKVAQDKLVDEFFEVSKLVMGLSKKAAKYCCNRSF